MFEFKCIMIIWYFKTDFLFLTEPAITKLYTQLQVPHQICKQEVFYKYLINAGIFYEARCITGQNAMSGHHKYFVGTSVFEDLCHFDKHCHIINQIILQINNTYLCYLNECFKNLVLYKLWASVLMCAHMHTHTRTHPLLKL